MKYPKQIPQPDYRYFTSEEIKAHLEVEMAEFEAVMAKYPDAQKASYRNMPGGGTILYSHYFSPSIVHDNVELHFAGSWYNLDVYPLVKVPTKFGDVLVYNDPKYLQPFWWEQGNIHQIQKSIAHWNDLEEQVSQLGYSDKILKPIYNQIIKLMSERDSGMDLDKNGVPDYILNKLPFI